MQLSLVGPPQPPTRSASADRLRRRVLAALAATLAVHELDPRIINDATDAVVAELVLDRRGYAIFD